MYYIWFYLKFHRFRLAVYLKTDGTGWSIPPQLATISSPWWRDGADDGSMGQRDRWRRDK